MEPWWNPNIFATILGFICNKSKPETNQLLIEMYEKSSYTREGPGRVDLGRVENGQFRGKNAALVETKNYF